MCLFRRRCNVNTLEQMRQLSLPVSSSETAEKREKKTKIIISSLCSCQFPSPNLTHESLLEYCIFVGIALFEATDKGTTSLYYESRRTPS